MRTVLDGMSNARTTERPLTVALEENTVRQLLEMHIFTQSQVQLHVILFLVH